jgi:hypothetical protein
MSKDLGFAYRFIAKNDPTEVNSLAKVMEVKAFSLQI